MDTLFLSPYHMYQYLDHNNKKIISVFLSQKTKYIMYINKIANQNISGLYFDGIINFEFMFPWYK